MNADQEPKVIQTRQWKVERRAATIAVFNEATKPLTRAELVNKLQERGCRCSASLWGELETLCEKGLIDIRRGDKNRANLYGKSAVFLNYVHPESDASQRRSRRLAAMLDHLKSGPLTVGELAKLLQENISHLYGDLLKLRSSGLVDVELTGYQGRQPRIRYRLAQPIARAA